MIKMHFSENLGVGLKQKIPNRRPILKICIWKSQNVLAYSADALQFLYQIIVLQMGHFQPLFLCYCLLYSNGQLVD